MGRSADKIDGALKGGEDGLGGRDRTEKILVAALVLVVLVQIGVLIIAPL